MPDAPVRLVVQDLCERPVHPAALRQARALAYRRADQRMAEAQPVHVEVDDPGLSRGFQQFKPQRAPGNDAGSLEDLAGAFVVVAVRCDQQKQLGRLGQIGHAGGEGLLEPLGERQRAGRDRLHPCRGDRQLLQGQRIAGRLAQQPVTNHRGELRRRRVQQCHRVGGRETAEVLLRQPGINQQRRVTLAHRGQQHDRIGLQAPGHEREHFYGRAVEPLRILGLDQQRRVGRGLTEQIKNSHRDPESLRRRLLAHSEGRVEHRALRRRQARRVETQRAK